MSKIILLVALGFISSIQQTGLAAATESNTESKNAGDEYKVGDEVLKAILSSIQKNKFSLSLNFAATVDPDKDKPSIIDIFDMQAVMLFRHDPKGLNIPLQAPDESLNKQERRLLTYLHTNLNDKYAVLKVQKSQGENEFEGDLLFYSRKKNEGKVQADYIGISINSELLDIKKIFLYGARLKITLAGSRSTKEEIKKGVLKALLECRADSESIDLFRGKTIQTPIEKCLFRFDGEKYRVEYKEAMPKY